VSALPNQVDVADIYRRHLSSGKARLGEMLGGHVEVSSLGSLVTTATGVELLDCGGYGVFLLGHCHSHVVEAVRAQIDRLPLVTRILLEPVQAQAAALLAELAPEGLERVYFGTSGADVVEAALKLARLNGKRRLVSVEGGFHGKTFGALSVCGNSIVRDPFAPLLPGTEILPFGDAAALNSTLESYSGECCVIVEPIQAEGGVRIPTAGYLVEAAAACRRHGALLALDEIATGLGRTGLLWECEREGVVPDMMLIGKPLSGGVVPVGAVVATEAVFAPLDRDPHIHSATFAGAAIAMAAARATLEVIVEDDVPARSRRLGASIRAGLDDALAEALELGLVREVRGQGLLLGVELESPHSAGDLEIELLARRVIPNHCLNHHAVVRLTPSAYMTDAQTEWLIAAVRSSVDAMVARRERRSRSRSSN
jgi:putrescine aminotransferase